MNQSKRFRVLFVCIGNSCRSPMAEAIARSEYNDVLEAESAGIAPAPIVQPQTYESLKEINVFLEPGRTPRKLVDVDWNAMDIIVNMSGSGILPLIPGYKGQQSDLGRGGPDRPANERIPGRA
ncbi:MAG: low molecular weight phosphatase family protein [Bryobacterales bacterium]